MTEILDKWIALPGVELLQWFIGSLHARVVGGAPLQAEPDAAGRGLRGTAEGHSAADASGPCGWVGGGHCLWVWRAGTVCKQAGGTVYYILAVSATGTQVMMVLRRLPASTHMCALRIPVAWNTSWQRPPCLRCAPLR